MAARDGGLTTFNHEQHHRELRPFATVPGAISSLSTSADGSALILGTEQGSIFRLAGGSLAVTTLMMTHAAQVNDVAFAEGANDCVATCSDAGDICVWSTQDYSLVCRVQEPTQAGGALCVAMTGDMILSGWGDGSIRAYARAVAGVACRPLWTIPNAHALAHSVGVTALAISHRGLFFITGGMGGEVRAWDMRSREMVAHMKLHAGRICDVAVMGDDAHIVAASEDRT